MTESEWMRSSDPAAMLSWAIAPAPPGGHRPPRRDWYPSDRKLRLFACASSRLLLSRVTSPPVSPDWVVHLREGTAAAERWADGCKLDWKRARNISPLDEDAANGAITSCRNDDLVSGGEKATLLREIVGDPFRPVTLPLVRACWKCGRVAATTDRGANAVLCECGIWHDGTSYCPWLTPTVLSLAQAAYEERLSDGTLDAFRLAVLADAIEDAGYVCTEVETKRLSKALDACFCDDGRGEAECDKCMENRRLLLAVEGVPSLLTHLRSPGTHFRGCWALDLILGKE